MSVWQAILELHGFLQFLLLCSAYYLLRFILRGIIICVRGWPPAHLDADGDWQRRESD